jgi:hypothetical protein
MPSRDEIAEFSTLIQSLADERGEHCMDVIVQHCNETGVEVEVAATLLSTHLKARIREEAQSINLIKKSSSLPL